MNAKADVGGRIDGRAALQVATCMLVSASEGFDLASAGLSGPTMIAAFGLSRSEFGLTITALMAGFFFGAWRGGALGDRYGRRLVMLLSMGLLGVFCLVASRTHTLPPLLVARFAAGLGLGGVMPNMLALAAESVSASARSRAVTLANCGGSLGGISAGLLLALGGSAISWRTYFLVGGAAPLLIIPIAWAILPENKRRDDPPVTRGAASAVLFGSGRTGATLLLWLASFLTASVYYAVGYWSPIFLAQRGLPSSGVGAASMLLSTSAMIGALFLATLFDRGRRRLAALLAYGGMIVALPIFTVVHSLPAIMASSALLGLTVFGGQLLLYAIMAGCYPPAHRGAGVGAGVAVGRIGAIISPLAMGLLLDHAAGPQNVVLLLMPLVLVAGLGAFWVARREAVAV